MTGTLRPVFGRALAVALLLAAVAAVPVFVVAPAMDAHSRLDQQIATDRALAARLNALAAEGEALRTRLEDLRRGDPAGDQPGGVHLTGASEALAAAELQTRLRGYCAEGRCQLRSALALPVVDEGGFRRIGLRVSLTAGIEGLNGMLHRLESSKPYLMVDALELRTASDTVARPSETEPGDLQVRLDVSGFARVAGP